MALCRWCRERWSDIEDWPEYDREQYRPDCCHQCYTEDPRRCLDPEFTEAEQDKEELEEEAELSEREELEELNAIDDMDYPEEEDTEDDDM